MVPIAVNFHLIEVCNARCRFCFATFREVDGRLPIREAQRVLVALREAGAQKMTFAGGEPTLHRGLGRLLEVSKDLGFVTCVVTNGARLGRLLDSHAAFVDWVGLSVDSGIEDVQTALGRGTGGHVAAAIEHAERCRSLEIRLKLNTVVTALTWQEDLSWLVRRIQPERWKVFQVLPMGGQNDGSVEDLMIGAEQFGAFVEQHGHLAAEGFAPIVEDNDAMRGSYVMVDPLGRFFGNATGRHVTSDPILEVGVDHALSQVGFSPSKFVARGGVYPW